MLVLVSSVEGNDVAAWTIPSWRRQTFPFPGQGLINYALRKLQVGAYLPDRNCCERLLGHGTAGRFERRAPLSQQDGLVLQRGRLCH